MVVPNLESLSQADLISIINQLKDTLTSTQTEKEELLKIAMEHENKLELVDGFHKKELELKDREIDRLRTDLEREKSHQDVAFTTMMGAVSRLSGGSGAVSPTPASSSRKSSGTF
jgi:predicted RNase H-like nuclease (RuvC/YqgF family)